MLPLQVLAHVLGVRLASTLLMKVCFISLYTRLLLPASTASVLAVLVVGLVHMYVSISLSIYLSICMKVLYM